MAKLGGHDYKKAVMTMQFEYCTNNYEKEENKKDKKKKEGDLPTVPSAAPDKRPSRVGTMGEGASTGR